MPNLTKMTIRVSAAEWNDLTTRLAAAEKMLAAAEKKLAATKAAEASRLARNLKERCRHLLVGKTGSARRKWYDSATQSQRDARIEEILIEVGVKEAPKKCHIQYCENAEVANGWCAPCWRVYGRQDRHADFKKCATTGCPNKEYEDGWCEECCADADREGELSDEE
jgi:hypothetical protein